MGEIYKNPIRVYLLLGLLAVWGVLAGFSLPISLFPDSSKPTVGANVPYGGLSAEEFYQSFGGAIEGQLKGIVIDGRRVENLTAEYRQSELHLEVEFQWDVAGETALQEVRTSLAGLSASWPDESRKFYNVYTWRENGGFLALSFFSATRSLDDLYELLNPLVSPMAAAVPDANGVFLYNPKQKRIDVTLDPERLALLHVSVSGVENAIRSANESLSAGRITLGDSKIGLEIPRRAPDLESLRNLPLYTSHGTRLQLRDVADVQLKTDLDASRSFKTSGVPSLILFADPKPGGNIKKMAEDIIAAVEKIKPQLPSDVEYKILVNPAEFINSSVRSVAKEVGLAAILAVVILLIFIGSLKNVITAAIEIPLSLVMAFIFMKFFDMNLNLISLGGLALSAGMNVDASVVVMENIFRKFDQAKGRLNAEDRLQLVLEAVREVWLPVVAATVASLVVFIPLIMTSGLTNSILGDLAKAVVFSHSMSAVVALILVPTIRLQMMKSETSFHLESPIERQFNWLEGAYARSLALFIRARKVRYFVFGGVVLLLGVLTAAVLPRLPVEIIGRPETDWVMLGYGGAAFVEPRQIESFSEKLEFEVLKEFGEKVAYTFTQINGSRNGMIMMRLNDRSDMDQVWKQLEERYVNSPDVYYWSEPWNPSELPIPDPAHFEAEVRGGTPETRASVARDLELLILESQIFPRVRVTPSAGHSEHLVLRPYVDVLQQLAGSTQVGELANYVRVVTEGKRISELTVDNKTYSVQMNVNEKRIKNIEELKALPVGVGEKVIPLSALLDIKMEKEPPSIYRWNQSTMSRITARVNESDKPLIPAKKEEMQKLLKKWQAERKSSDVTVTSVPPDHEIKEALNQLKWALVLSVLLIFVTMVVQFGDLMHAALVLVAIPLGFIGVLSSLFIFGSTLSLNSALGTILLNGIAVANSIILVDFMKKLVDSGMEPEVAAVEASRARLRPILMTSLTTVLGMMPIALGFGEGGRILQPLGIAVAGGLWISMLLTIYFVPTLQAIYLRYKINRSGNRIMNKAMRDRQLPGLEIS